MEIQSLLQADYLDIVFANRNKNYGGYPLRKHYNQRVLRAAAIAFSVVLSGCLYSFVKNDHTPVADRHIVTMRPTVIDMHKVYMPPAPHKLAPPPATAAPKAPKAINTTTFTPPKIVHNDDVHTDQQLAPVKTLANNNPVLHTAAGDGKSLGKVDGLTGGTDIGLKTTSTNTPSGPVQWVEQMPAFNGDVSSYIASHLHYPDAARDANVEGKVIIRFVVNEDGSISNAEVVRGIGNGCDQEALRVVTAMPHWKPGMMNGHAVKVYFTLPITFVLQ